MWSLDPATGAVREELADTTEAEVESRLSAATGAQGRWGLVSVADRAKTLRRVAAALEMTAEVVAEEVSNETGQPLAAALDEVTQAVSLIRFACSLHPELEARTIEQTAARSAYLSHRPFGVVLAVCPWSFPVFEIVKIAVPALLAGNAVMLKPASNTPATTLAIEELMHDSGVPPGLFNVLFIDAPRTAALIDDPRIGLVSFTGSTEVGIAVAKRAAATLTPTRLHLSASDPYLVLEDADLDLAAELTVRSRLLFSGQSCLAAKRAIVVESVRREFEQRVVERMARVVMGHPKSRTSELGPMARGDLRDRLDDQVRASVLDGARRLLGGFSPEGPGFYYPPTVLSDVEAGMPAFDEELYGPVLPICSAPTEDDAIHLANRSRFGLGGAVFTRDVERGRAIAELELRAGSCFVNARVSGDPRLPLGGVGASGWGRSAGVEGLLELTQPKVIYVG